MNQSTTLDQSNGVEGTIPKKTRSRHPLPPPEARDWMTANETALALGCSVATVHRLRRGAIPGVEPLPCSRYGRKSIFRKASIHPVAGQQREKRANVVLQLPQVQEFVAEARERHALMTT